MAMQKRKDRVGFTVQFDRELMEALRKSDRGGISDRVNEALWFFARYRQLPTSVLEDAVKVHRQNQITEVSKILKK